MTRGPYHIDETEQILREEEVRRERNHLATLNSRIAALEAENERVLLAGIEKMAENSTLTAQLADAETARETLDRSRNDAQSALLALVMAKDYKEHAGDNETYRRMKEEAWKRARAYFAITAQPKDKPA